MRYFFGALVPPEVLPLLLMVSGILFIVGMRRLGGLIILFVLAKAFLLPFASSLIALLPAWMIVPVMVVFVVGIFRGLLALLIGKGAAETMVGTLAADFFKVLFLFPLMAGRLLVRLMRRA